MQARINRKIKYRESFRPFAPAVPSDRVAEFFQLEHESLHMTIVAPLRPSRRSELPAVTHVDHSARVQTVDPGVSPLFHKLLRTFGERSGCPVLVNTSFNMRGEPIVCTPEDAYRCFLRTDMDLLALGPFLLEKQQQHRARTHGAAVTQRRSGDGRPGSARCASRSRES